MSDDRFSSLFVVVKLFSKNSNLFDHGTWSLQTDGRTDDMQSHNRALHIALRGKNLECASHTSNGQNCFQEPFKTIEAVWISKFIWQRVPDWQAIYTDSVNTLLRMLRVSLYAGTGLSVWNSLTDELGNSDSFDSFKRFLKTIPFSRYLCNSALEDFKQDNALYKSAFYLLTYLLTYCNVWTIKSQVRERRNQSGRAELVAVLSC